MDTVFYDGTCGLCHRGVRFVLRRDPKGERFEFAPLRGDTFARRVAERRRAELPDSMIVQHPAGAGNDLLVKSDAVLHILRRLGGMWGFLAAVGRAVPRGLRDWGYDRVAAVRHRWFTRPPEACPLMPAELRGRFKA